MTGAGRLWGIAAIGVLALLPIQVHAERDEVGAVSVRADAADPLGTIFPSDLFTVHDFGQVTHRRVALPKPDCTTNPNNYFDIDVLNELDGSSLQDPHCVLTSNNVASMRTIALAAQRQAAILRASMSTTTIDFDDMGPLFEMPIRQPLPKTLDFIP